MKKLLMIGSTLALLSTSAHATQARLLALGMNETDNEGMYYISDSRNIFLNAAYVNLYSDMVITEWGSTGLGVGGSATVDQNHRPKAQGGILKKFGDMVYGVYYGNESNTSALLRIVGTQPAGIATPIPTADNQIDLFVGGDAGVKWGANVVYASNEDEIATVKAEDKSYAVRLGAIGTGWDAHANISLGSEAETLYAAGTLKQEFDGKIGYHLGGSFNVSDKSKVFGYVKHYGWEQKATNVAVVKGDFTSYYLGWGGQHDVDASGRIFYGVTGKKTDINLKYANKGEVRHLIIPVNLGYEAVATEWLTLRGSIVQNLYGKRDNKRLAAGGTDLNNTALGLVTAIYGTTGKATLSNSSEVNAGATLTFGNLAVDGLIGLTGANRGTGSTGAATPNKNQGLLTFDNFASRVAVTYKF